MGADDARGADAGSAGAGGDAGSICLTLASGSDPGTFRVDGFVVRADGARFTVAEELAYGAAGFVELLAFGGQGGAGGAGGRGGDGARGRPGSDASRYHGGSDGGPGGDGGDGGKGSEGGRGGHGGHVRLIVAEQDTQLLMLARHQVAGGDGGAPDLHGAGGFGGAGSRGRRARDSAPRQGAGACGRSRQHQRGRARGPVEARASVGSTRRAGCWSARTTSGSAYATARRQRAPNG